MDFRTAAKYGPFFPRIMQKMSLRYCELPGHFAPEVAARVNLHIKTAQDFLELLEQLGLTSKEEVLEKMIYVPSFSLLPPDETRINHEIQY